VIAAVAAAVAGTVGGALLPVPVFRLSVPYGSPHRTVCANCPTSPRVRVPPRCPQCGLRWGPPMWTTAAVAGLAALVVALALGPQPVLPLFVALCVVGTGLGAIDLACQRLPTVIVGPAIVVGAVSLTVLAAITGDWPALGRALAGGVGLGLLYQLLYLLPGEGIGYGDVRLAVLLGLFLGWLGWAEVVGGALLPWLVNGPVVLGLLLAGRVHRKSRLPFGPAMLGGALLAIVLPAAVPALLD